jgi:hypothetical protein
MIFLNFSQLSKSVFRLNFSLTGKHFPLTNFFNINQTQKNLKNNFLKNNFEKTIISLK